MQRTSQPSGILRVVIMVVRWYLHRGFLMHVFRISLRGGNFYTLGHREQEKLAPEIHQAFAVEGWRKSSDS